MALTIKKLRVPFTQASQFRYEIYDGDNLYAVTDNEDRANKIAAAPKLYEVLKSLHDKLEPYAGDFDKDTLAVLTAAEMAINLAEGK